jgi:hypothetical protein
MASPRVPSPRFWVRSISPWRQQPLGLAGLSAAALFLTPAIVAPSGTLALALLFVSRAADIYRMKQQTSAT